MDVGHNPTGSSLAAPSGVVRTDAPVGCHPRGGVRDKDTAWVVHAISSHFGARSLPMSIPFGRKRLHSFGTNKTFYLLQLGRFAFSSPILKVQKLQLQTFTSTTLLLVAILEVLGLSAYNLFVSFARVLLSDVCVLIQQNRMVHCGKALGLLHSLCVTRIWHIIKR